MLASVTYPTTDGKVIACPLCGTGGNNLVVSEPHIEHRFNMPVLPVRDYNQASCRKCGLLYINAPIDQSYLNELYASESVEWATELLGTDEARMNDDERARFAEVVRLAAAHKDLRGAEWLDFGCQTGELGEEAIRKHGVVMSGVEISDDYAERAAKLWGRERNAVHSSIGGHKGKKFDVISSLETLEHMAEPGKMVAEFGNHLKPGGLLVVSVPSSHYFRLKYHAFKLARSMRSRPAKVNGPSVLGLCHTHLYNFTPDSLSLLLEQQGFKTLKVAGIGWLSRYKWAEVPAKVLESGTRGGMAVFPSILAIARRG